MAGVAEFAQAPPGSGTVGRGAGVEEIAGLVVGQSCESGVGAQVPVGEVLSGSGSGWVTNTGPWVRPRSNRGSSRAVQASQ